MPGLMCQQSCVSVCVSKAMCLLAAIKKSGVPTFLLMLTEKYSERLHWKRSNVL